MVRPLPVGGDPVLLVPFLLMSVVGLALSVVAHAAALLGLSQPLGGAAWGLHVGIFVVWVPTVVVANRLCADHERKDFWGVVLRGCPRWARVLVAAFFVYAVVNFVTFTAVAPGKAERRREADTPPVVFRGFSGHWMAFYSAAAAVLYTAIAVGRRGAPVEGVEEAALPPPPHGR